MEFTLLMWVIAALPIIVLLFLMSYIKLNSRKAALISLGLTAFLGGSFYQLYPRQMLISAGKGAALSLYVALIIIGAVFLYNIVDISGGFTVIKQFMESIGGDRTLQFIGLSWAFSGFIQGVTGFGVPVAIVGALLIGVGYKPLVAITAVLVGHSWAISFGSMGSSFFALQLVTGLEPISLGVTLALFFFIPILTTGLAVAHIYGGTAAIKKNFKYILPMSILMGLAQLGAAAGGFAHVGSLLGGLVGTSFFLIVLVKNVDTSLKEYWRYKAEDMYLLSALLPYAILIGTVLLFQLPFIQSILPDLSLDFSFPGFTTGLGYEVEAEPSFSPIVFFSHPIFFLLLASTAGGALYARRGHLTRSRFKEVLGRSYQKARSSVLTVFILMIMALIMNDSGMIFNFAQGMARFSQASFPLVSPFIGILGAFLTGSNTSSNVLFGAFQVDTAGLLGFPPEVLASTQSLGGSLGSAIAPAKILLGTSVVGIAGKEGEIIKRCLSYTLASGLIVGLAALIVSILI
ncbi:MAG: L-lactate permease [Bacillota bacterium]